MPVSEVALAQIHAVLGEQRHTMPLQRGETRQGGNASADRVCHSHLRVRPG
ncbi:hypothetical protein SCALM49S_01120 [Streptomyces californicus]